MHTYLLHDLPLTFVHEDNDTSRHRRKKLIYDLSHILFTIEKYYDNIYYNKRLFSGRSFSK